MNRLFTTLAGITGIVLALAPSLVLAQPDFDDVEVQILPVRDNIYMLVGAGGNITVQTGEQGVLIVDTQFAEMSDRILAALAQLSDAPLRYIINTHFHGDHVGGNVNLARAGSTVSGGNMQRDVSGDNATVIAHESVLLRLTTTGADADRMDPDGWPTSSYFAGKKDLYFNGEGIRVMHQPRAHTDGDSIVFFRKSDVIAVGDVYRTDAYPFIDIAAGGTIQGFLDAAQAIIDEIIPEYGQDGGTLVIPGHGRLSDIGDVLNWREMLTIIRDRVQALKDEGMSLEQVLSARPSRDYDARYGDSEPFITAVYNTL